MRNRSNNKKSAHDRRPNRTAKTAKSTKSTKSAWGNERLRLYGVHTVLEALANPDRNKHRMLISTNALKRFGEEIARIAPNIETKEVNPRELDQMVGRDAVHQGLILECDPLSSTRFEDLVPGDNLLLLDQVSDPHNVGAIMRSCVAMGIKTMIITSRNSAAQTAVLAKSASGALDLINLVEVSNLSRIIGELNHQGYQTIGLDSDGPDILENSITSDQPVALVLGAEGKGLRQKSRETCSTLARLDMPGKIRSLNVSNAAVLALYVIGRAGKV